MFSAIACNIFGNPAITAVSVPLVCTTHVLGTGTSYYMHVVRRALSRRHVYVHVPHSPVLHDDDDDGLSYSLVA